MEATMSKFFNSHTKKINKEKANDIKQVVSTYFMHSALFWIILSLFFYFYLYDPSYGPNTKLKLTSSWSLFAGSFSVIFLTLVFSSIIGFILSFPSILIKSILIYKLSRRKQWGQRPVILIFVTKYFPYIVLYFINISFLLFNFSVSPELMSNILSPKNSLVLLSKKLHPHIVRKKTEDFYAYGRAIGDKYQKDSSFVFLLPSNIVNNSNFLVKTKILLSNSSKILITNSYKPDIVSSLYHFYPPGFPGLYSNIPFRSKSMINDRKKTTYIGIDGENWYIFSSLFGHIAHIREIKLTWFYLFLNKFAFSQPQFFYFFKSGFAAHFTQLWDWSNLYNSDTNLLKRYSNELLRENKNSYSNFVFFLTGLEENQEKKLLTQYNQGNLNKQKSNLNHKKEDLFLAQFIGGLMASGVKKIHLLPYNYNEKMDLQNVYSSEDLNKKIFLTENFFDNNISSEKETQCFLKTMDLDSNNFEFNLIDQNNHKDKNIYLDEKYRFFIKSKLRNKFICYSKESSVYLIIKNNDNFNLNNFSYGQNFLTIFENYSENKSYLKLNKIKTNLSSEKSNKLFKQDFLNHFKIYKIDNNIGKFSLVQNTSEKENLFKNFGDDIIKEMFQYVNK